MRAEYPMLFARHSFFRAPKTALAKSQLFTTQDRRLPEYKNLKLLENNGLISAMRVQQWFDKNTHLEIVKTPCCRALRSSSLLEALTFLSFSLLRSDSSPRGLSDRGVRGRLQSQGPEGGSSG